MTGDMTDTLRVSLPPTLGPVNTAGAKAALGAFGEVAKIKMLPAKVGPIREVLYIVTYFDVRHAENAARCLDTRVHREAPAGQRTIWLPGDFELDPKLKDEIADVSRDPDEGFWIEFYDSRTAADVATKAGVEGHSLQPAYIEPPKESEPSLRLDVPPSLEAECLEFERLAGPPGSWPSHGSSAAVATESSIESSEVEPQKFCKPPPGLDVPPGLDTELLAGPPGLLPSHGNGPAWTVYVRGLPNAICNDLCMEAVLQQAGLKKDVESCESYPGHPCGEAFIRFKSHRAAKKALANWQGLHWDDNMPVSAVMTSTPSAETQPQRPKEPSSLRGRAPCGASWAERALSAPVWAPKLAYQAEHKDSEVSTDAGSQADEDPLWISSSLSTTGSEAECGKGLLDAGLWAAIA